MMPRSVCVAGLLLLTGGVAFASAAGPSMHGLGLGMTPNEAAKAVNLPCSKLPYSNELDCRDAGDGSDYRATFSAGDPSVALSVQRSFCSKETKETLLGQALADLKVGNDRAHRDPNGYHIDLDGNNEAIINADDGSCPADKGAHYMLTIRSNNLINLSGEKAVERLRKSMH